MTVFATPGCNVRLLVAWSITAQSSPAGRTRGAGLMGAEVRVLMVVTWFDMRFFPWRQRAWLLYLCTCGTVGFYFAFKCAAGVICSVSSGTMWGARWGSHLSACPGWKDMSPCGSTLGGGKGAASGVDYGVYTIGGGMGDL